MARTSKNILNLLTNKISGKMHTDQLTRRLYATDASIYREIPMGVVYPQNAEDLVSMVQFCKDQNLSIIPRSGGTSLAGQCVGDGLICDVSRYMNAILDIDEDGGWAIVEPGVIRDELNHHLKESNLFFGPNTATSNRATLGGMVGNNSSGTSSIKYGTTRDKVLAIEMILHDGSQCWIHPYTLEESPDFLQHESLAKVDAFFREELMNPETQKSISEAFPKKEIKRRNSGYALDTLIDEFKEKGVINLCKVICGSEGTLGLISKIKIKLDVKPPKFQSLVCLYYDDIIKALRAVPKIIKFKPFACELMDDKILDCTNGQPMYQQHRKLIKGNPKAVLMIELRRDNQESLRSSVEEFISGINVQSHHSSYGVYFDREVEFLWELRKAGLGLLANIPGTKKAIACIEDTAVAVDDLADYIAEFQELIAEFGQDSVYYAHAGEGELHLRPILDLSSPKDKKEFIQITQRSAELVKKYNGSLSGEHGDGRVRAPWLELFYGKEVYGLLKEWKLLWDPNNIFNPGKIVDPNPLTEDLRSDANTHEPTVDYAFNTSIGGGVLDQVKRCNGSGDCRKLSFSGGVMCPSYRATREEIHSTRGRANALRELLTSNVKSNPFAHPDIAEAMDLCIGCKGCSKECPSNVDISTIKSEYLFQRYKTKRRPLRDYLFAFGPEFAFKNKLIFNIGTRIINSIPSLKNLVGITDQRRLPLIEKLNLNFNQQKGNVLIYADKLTSLYAPHLIKDAHELLRKLGFSPMVSPPLSSCRPLISKGFLTETRKKLGEQIPYLMKMVNDGIPIVGIEPSAVMVFRDELKRLIPGSDSEAIGERFFTMEEFLFEQATKGRISGNNFIECRKTVHFHGHCHYKSLGSMEKIKYVMGLVDSLVFHVIESGCCGMAGSFGYEKEHYTVSMKMAELELFPYMRKHSEDVVVTQGLSCDHQIMDGLGRKSINLISLLSALVKVEN